MKKRLSIYNKLSLKYQCKAHLPLYEKFYLIHEYNSIKYIHVIEMSKDFLNIHDDFHKKDSLAVLYGFCFVSG
ncbi:hypothetical protein QUF76_17715, partial [Desulfobacterales bacterium HSG16]|nr:hypothetical protein [Desulfobacterales bacterium HSG16]